MASVLVQTAVGNATNATGSAALKTAAFAGNTVTGNILIAVVFCASATDDVTAVSDGTNSFTKIFSKRIATTGAGWLSFWYAANITGKVTPQVSVTVTTPAGKGGGIICREYSGIQASLPLDKSTSLGGTTTAISSGASAATTSANELVIGGGCSDFGNNTYTVGAGYGNLISTKNADLEVSMEDKVVAATGAQTATMTLGNASDNAGGVATFIVAAGGGGGITAQQKASFFSVF